ncbi:YwqG family protein [Amycolatopsis cynarae]|uniref:YwqG family protein n=1 Tax=Amycolatopsis cynarae TaxID=2995223 RepID=A0ABY7AV44_9PSEU|nr:YwqG family protein [Amycolatopsis sp. HUAS 11-8]WAL63569.1 YwqG family protein [Amycolatopsis sp. HUAS 11-8]
MSTREQLERIARSHLPEAVAERWIALIRPTLRLRPAGPEEAPAGRLGGVPAVPGDFAWPEWPGQGPLNLVASIDCGRLPAGCLDPALPSAGTLLFFYFDEGNRTSQEEFVPPVGTWDPETLAGARVVHVPAGVPVAVRGLPGGVDPYQEVPLAAEATVTGPDFSHPVFRDACRDLPEKDRAFLDDWSNGEAFGDALDERFQPPMHQLGGYAFPIQNPVETEVGFAHVPENSGDRAQRWKAAEEEGKRWVLLAQIDSDPAAGMMWGDAGMLYWLIRREDLAAGDFPAASFTWQCS